MMHHFHYTEQTMLEINSIGIPEPTAAKPADLSKVDLVLMPLLAADRNMNRIGYGGGFYDRLLKHTDAKKVGLSLAPFCDQIQWVDPWDAPMDHVLIPF